MAASWSPLALLGAAALAGPSTPQDEAAGTLLVRAERLIVRPGEERRDVSVLVQHGRIVAVGEGLEAPEGARELEGAVVCAGLVDPWSSLGLDAGSVADMRTSPATETTDAVDVWEGIEERRAALEGGVTVARVQAGQWAPIGGVGAVIRAAIDDGGDVVLPDACVSASVGVTRGDRKPDVFDRIAEVDKLVGQIERGLRYREEWAAYRRELAEWEEAIAEKTEELEEDFKKAKKKREKEMEEAEEEGEEFEEERYKEDRKPRLPKHDADAEVMARVAHGELPLAVEIHRAPEIRYFLEKTAGFGRLRPVLVGGTEALAVADELAEREVPVVLWPSPLGEGRSDEWAEHDLALAGRLAEADVRVLIGSGGASNPRDLRLVAALAVGHGLGREAALAAITSAPAEVFDLGGRLGSVERGKEAELLMLDGDPLDSTTQILHVISGGRVVGE